MDETGNEPAIFVFSPEAVRRAVERLASTPSHEHLPGYLAVVQAAGRESSKSVHMSDIDAFHENYLHVLGNEKSPYLRPFKSRGTGVALLNKNVSGSYSPRTLRAGGKLPEIIEVAGEGAGAVYSLKPSHETKALSILLRNHKIPAASLAVFLLRDYGFIGDKPSVSECLIAFRDLFGFKQSIDSQRRTYDVLFEDDSAHYSDDDIVQLIT